MEYRVAVLSDLLFLQRLGGLQRQAHETVSALRQIGIDARFFDPINHQLEDFDLAHVFDAEGGNERLVAVAKGKGLPVILSPVISANWTPAIGLRARLCESFVQRITRWKVHTNYAMTRAALSGATALIALTAIEKRTLEQAFRIDHTKIHIIPNGVSDHFFSAHGNLFRERYQLTGPLVLCVGTITRNKNQLALAKALAGDAITIVLVGPCSGEEQEYLREIQQYPRVVYVGSFAYDDPLIPSAYAAADVFVLPSLSEVFPLVVLEALAAGTPVVVTRRNSMALGCGERDLMEVTPDDIGDIRRQVLRFLDEPGIRVERRERVRQYSWNEVAKQLALVYESILRDDRPTLGDAT
jgi:glycosyltransferase involved in cell wall biosynthesis